MAALEDKELAQEWVKNNTDESPNSFRGEELQEAYLAGAELKEKHIVELEQENAELKEKISDVIGCFESSSSGDDFEMAESAREVMEVLSIPCYRHGDVKSKLTKAKEIIEKLSKSLFLAKGSVRDLIDDTVDFKESKERAIYCYEQKYFDTYKKAMQFLKELAE